MPVCPNCGREAPSDKASCPSCGTPLPQASTPSPQPTAQAVTPTTTGGPPSEIRWCSQCGRAIASSAKFCPWCGTGVPISLPTAAPPPAQPPSTTIGTQPSPVPSYYPPTYYPPSYYPQPPHTHRPYEVALALLLVGIVIFSGVVANIEFFHIGINAAPADPYAVITDSGSQNWSGFVIETAAGQVTDVKGTWTIPQISCSAGGQTYSAQWVGIDGRRGGSGTVEQAGTEYDCNNGSINIFAWYEWYPAFGRLFQQPSVAAGDTMTIEIKWDGRQFIASINDATQGWTINRTNSTIGALAARSSAEWVVEAPLVSGSIAPLTDFNKLYFSKCYATVNRSSGPMGSFSLDMVNMVDSTGAVKARPVLPLWNDGTSFSVWWLKAGP